MQETSLSKEFIEITSDILNHPLFLGLKNIAHHGNGLYDHCLAVGFRSYAIAKTLGLDYKSVARAALLHDFFFTQWQEKVSDATGLDRIKDMHGFSHPKTALDNAKKYFDINEKEADMIVKHMFPLTIAPPMYMESWLVSIVDKAVAVREMVQEHTPRKLYRKLRFQN